MAWPVQPTMLSLASMAAWLQSNRLLNHVARRPLQLSDYHWRSPLG